MSWNLDILSRKSIFSTSMSRVCFLSNTLTDLGLKLPEITFSIMKENRIVIGELLIDSMIMKDKSALLSEESNSERLC